MLLLGDAWALLTFGVPHEIALLTGIALAFGLLCIFWMRDWNAFGQVTWTATQTENEGGPIPPVNFPLTLGIARWEHLTILPKE